MVELIAAAAIGRLTSSKGAVPVLGDRQDGKCTDAELNDKNYDYETYNHRSFWHPISGTPACAKCPKDYKFHKTLRGTNLCDAPSADVVMLREREKAQQLAQTTYKAAGHDSKKSRVEYTKQRAGGSYRYYRVGTDGSKTRLPKEEFAKRKKQQEKRSGGTSKQMESKKGLRVKYETKRSGGSERCYKTSVKGVRTRISREEFKKAKVRQTSLSS